MDGMENGPRIQCARMTLPDEPDSWETIARAFASAQPVAMRQGWRETPDADLRPAEVRTAWTARELLVYAVLADDDIFNPETEFNAMAFQKGDVFEIFLRPAAQDAYYEFHVSPLNQLFQLRIPSGDAFKTPKPAPGIPGDWLIKDWKIDSRVLIEPERRQWRVLARIPTGRVAETAPVAAGDEWLYSFSRYDYTQGRPQPVYSSTSPHKELNYHRQQEWGRLVFA